MSSPSPETIRPATDEDLNGIAALFVRVFRSPPYGEDWELPVARQYLGDIMRSPARLAYVATAPGKAVAGFLLGTCHGIVRACVHEIAVDEELRRRGIGSALLGRFVDEVEQRGVRTVELLARRDMPAYRFYRKRGFRKPRRVTLLIRSLPSPGNLPPGASNAW